MFPDRVTYNRKNGTFRTDKVNEVFRYIAALNSVPGDNKKGQTSNETDLSNLVGMTGFEPAASSSRTKHATGLRSIPKGIIPYFNKFNFQTPLIKNLILCTP